MDADRERRMTPNPAKENQWRRVASLVGSLAFLLAAPGTVAGLAPWWIGSWRVHAGFPGFLLVQALGGLLMIVGLLFLLETFARFALEGLGTPAPLMPTRHLVVTGSYRFVRNPMYFAVLALILGQALLFGDVRIGIYAFCVWVGFTEFVRLYEEQTLRRTFPGEYAEFCAHVPRWIPRLTPWDGRGGNSQA